MNKALKGFSVDKINFFMRVRASVKMDGGERGKRVSDEDIAIVMQATIDAVMARLAPFDFDKEE